MKAILSIKPQFVEKILNGEKKYEYRKRIFKQEIDSVIIYSTMPVGMLVGEFKIEKVLHDNIDEIWEKTKDFSGISHEHYKKYFKNKGTAYALKLKDLLIYEKPICPTELILDFKPPQSFCYLK